jgi:G protein beta subunit-like protein
VSLHPNQSELYIGDQSGNIHVWDLRTEKKETIKTENADMSIQHLDIEADGNYLAAVDNKGYCYMFAINPALKSQSGSALQRRVKFQAHKKYALKCRFSPDSTLLATTSADQTAKIWKTFDLQPLADEGLATSSSCWSVSDAFKPMLELTDATQRWVWDVAFSGDSEYVVTASSDSMARLWSLSTGEVKREYPGSQKPLTALAFSDVTY